MTQDDSLQINPEDLEKWLEDDSKPKNKSERKKREQIASTDQDNEPILDEHTKSPSVSSSKTKSKSQSENPILPNISKVSLEHITGNIDLHIEYHSQSEPISPVVQQINRVLLDAFKNLL